jgi:F0F1-type ATP synthase membrane subunit b/b'
MQAIIEQVLNEEEKARQLVEAARQKAAALKARADEEANTIVSRSRGDATTLLKERIEKARQEAQELVNRATVEEEQKNKGLYESSRAKIKDLAAEISASILSSDIQKV